MNQNGSCYWFKSASVMSNCSLGTYADTAIGFCTRIPAFLEYFYSDKS